MSYKLLSKSLQPMEITIDESAKEHFKELMNWSEEEFKEHTKEVQDE